MRTTFLPLARLQQFVTKAVLPAAIRQFMPLVEIDIDISNPLDRGQTGKTVGTTNPGIIWSGKHFEMGVEAVVPVNERTGKNVGVRGQMQFFLDEDLLTRPSRPTQSHAAGPLPQLPVLNARRLPHASPRNWRAKSQS